MEDVELLGTIEPIESIESHFYLPSCLIEEIFPELFNYDKFPSHDKLLYLLKYIYDFNKSNKSINLNKNVNYTECSIIENIPNDQTLIIHKFRARIPNRPLSHVFISTYILPGTFEALKTLDPEHYILCVGYSVFGNEDIQLGVTGSVQSEFGLFTENDFIQSAKRETSEETGFLIKQNRFELKNNYSSKLANNLEYISKIYTVNSKYCLNKTQLKMSNSIENKLEYLFMEQKVKL